MCAWPVFERKNTKFPMVVLQHWCGTVIESLRIDLYLRINAAVFAAVATSEQTKSGLTLP